MPDGQYWVFKDEDAVLIGAESVKEDNERLKELTFSCQKPETTTAHFLLIEKFSFSTSVLANNCTEMTRVFTAYLLPGFMLYSRTFRSK